MARLPAPSTVLALLLVVALPLAACTGDDDGEASTGAQAEASLAAGDAAGQGSDGGPGSGVTVSGAGVASGEPDVVRITIGVEVERDEVQPALDAANQRTEGVIDALDEAGIGSDDRQTRDFAIHPRHDRDGGISGYAVRNLVEATIRDLDAIGPIVQSVADAAGDEVRIHGLRYDLEEDDSLVTAAREAAVQDARDKAEQYAELADRQLGELIALEDQTSSSPRQATFQEDAADEAAESGVPIEPGEQDVTVRVRARWTFD
ncbi:MAG: SIMPL domain-containing protein [Actinomycetota bacterium]